MNHPTYPQGSDPNRRSFLKMAAVALLGALAACVPGLKESPAIPAKPTIAPSKPTVIPASPLPTASPVLPTATPSVPPSETPTPPTATSAPTACPPDVECDQANLSVQNIRSRRARVLNPGPTYIITSLCLRDSGCVEVCPVECIVPGKPQSEWPRYYVDPYTCTDCDACIPECPYGAIFPEDEVPSKYVAKGGEYINRVGICGHYEGINHHGESVLLDTVCRLRPGQVVDLTVDIQDNYDFYTRGPGYKVLES